MKYRGPNSGLNHLTPDTYTEMFQMDGDMVFSNVFSLTRPITQHTLHIYKYFFSFL